MVPPTFSNGVTYDPVAGTITVPAGVIDFTVTVPTIDDTVVDSAAVETVPLTVGGVAATGGIIDNEQPTIVSVEPGAPGVDGDEVAMAISSLMRLLRAPGCYPPH